MGITTIPGASSEDLTTLQGSIYTDIIAIDKDKLHIYGLEGNDTITSTTGSETVIVDSGLGNDSVTFSAEFLSTSITLGEGSDIVNLEDFSGTIYGGVGNDTLTQARGRSITNTLARGDAGNDKLEFFNLANSTINSNSGNDIISIFGSITNTQVYAGRQEDTILASSEVNNSLIRGDAQDDIITIGGSLTKSIINGNADDDQIIITSQEVKSSSIYGGQGEDNIDISSGAIYVNGGKDGDDIDITSNEKHTVYGGKGEDKIDSSGTEYLFIDGGADNDTININSAAVMSGVHTVDGGAGNDILTGSSGKELFDGGTEDIGNDTIRSSGGNDTIYGRAGNDLIDLVSGVNDGEVLVQAGAGNDIIEVVLNELSHLDVIKGEVGNDTIVVVGNAADFNMWEDNTIAKESFNSISTVETLAFGSSNTSYTISGSKTIKLASKVQSAGIRTIDASNASGAGSDDLIVNAFQFSSSSDLNFIGPEDKDVNVHFTGGSGDDTLTTGKISEDDKDTLTGGLGVDTFNIVATDRAAEVTDLGLGGPDALIVSSSAKGVTATVKDDYIAPSTTKNEKASADVILNAESRVNVNMEYAGGSYGYVINGGAGSSTLKGSTYNDSITGNISADSIFGEAGNDTIYGGDGADTINAGKGNDLIEDAGIGNDIINHDVGSSLVIKLTGSDTVTLHATRAGAFVVITVAGQRTVDASSSTKSIGFQGAGAAQNQVTFTGGFADDTIDGGAATDLLIGNEGNDTITGGLSADTIRVGSGDNTVVFTSGLSVDIITEYDSTDIGSFDRPNSKQTMQL